METLVKKAINGDKDAFALLIEQNIQTLYKTAWFYLKNDEDIADAVQETILACYESIGDLQKAKYYKTWMIRILMNKCTDIVREKTRFAMAEEEKEPARVETQYTDCEWKMLMNQMEEKYGIILHMYYYEQLSVKEIAKLLKLKQNTVLTRLRRGRQLLKKELDCTEKTVLEHLPRKAL